MTKLLSKTKTNRYTTCKYKSVLPDNIVVLEEYINTNTPINHQCLICQNEWKASPTNIIHSTHPTGCPKCNHKSIRWTDVEFKSNLYKKHKNNIVSMEPYINAKTKIKFKCSKNHEYVTLPRYVLKSDSGGCSECSYIAKRAIHKMPAQLYKNLLKCNCEDTVKWIGHSSEYQNNSSELSFKCYKGHEFKFNALAMLSKLYACPLCPRPSRRWHRGKTNHSQKSIDCIKAIQSYTKIRFKHAATKWGEHRLSGTKYMIDGFSIKYKIAIEFHGTFFHGGEDKTSKKYLDTIKREEIIRNHEDIGLLIVVWEHEWDKNPSNVILKASGLINKYLKTK